MIEILKHECHRRMKEESLFRINKCLDQLSLEQVWQSTNGSTNSIGNLILHLEGNITQYILVTLGKEPDHRKRAQEFMPNQQTSKKELSERITKTIFSALSVIDRIEEDQLIEVKSVQGFDESVLGIIIHVIEHLSYHTGQITYITKSLLDKDMGYYKGLDLNVTT